MINVKYNQSVRGFTLIEVLLAVAIFAVISLASFTIFDGVMKSEHASHEKMQRLNAIQRAFIVIERDFLQIAQRSMRIEGEAPSTDFIYTSSNSFTLNEQAIAFVRAGWSNPGLLIPRSDMQSVAYRVNDNKLERLHYNFADPVVGEEPKSRVLLDQIVSLALQYFYDNKWQEKVIAQRLPQAVLLSIETQDFGLIERKFLVADKMLPSRSTNNNSSGNNESDNNSPSDNKPDGNTSGAKQ